MIELLGGGKTMKKLSMILTALFMVPIVAMSADKEIGQAAASSQQNAATLGVVATTAPAPAPATAASAPASAPQAAVTAAAPATATPASASASPSPDAAANPKSAVETISTAKVLSILTKEVISLQIDMNQLQQQNHRIRREIIQVQYVEYGLVALMVFLVTLLLVRRSQKPESMKSENQPKPANDDTQNEYDFMGSSEGIPAKLDLARAYIAMGDFVAARETLAEILQGDHEEYHFEAKTLLNRIN
jgi:FimV-like protein